MRVFVVKVFRRFQRKEKIADDELCEAIKRAERGLVGADLGGALIKQRVARRGEGRSGGYRTIVAYREGDRAVFLLGFAKRDRENIDEKERRALVKQGSRILGMTDDQIEPFMDDGHMSEIDYDDSR